MTNPTFQELNAKKLAPILAAWAEELTTPMFVERMSLVAMDRMVKYRAHIKAGFTDAQAIELCKS